MKFEDLIPIAKSLTFALLVGIIGNFIINKFIQRLEKRFLKVKVDETLTPFILSLSKIILKILLILSIIKIIGVDTSSFVALLASAGFAIGLAFQGSLSNFSGGVLLLTIRPFKVGDYIESGSYAGFVRAIKVLYTEILTPDNKVIFIPNGGLANTSIVNYTAMERRRVDFKISVSYGEKVDKVKKILKDIVDNHEKVLKDPEPVIRVIEHGKDSIVFALRVWALTEEYWDVYFDVMEIVKEMFDKEKIEIPFSQMDVTIKNK